MTIRTADQTGEGCVVFLVFLLVGAEGLEPPACWL